MLLVRRVKDMGMIGVSVAGGVSHNIGQLAMAVLIALPWKAVIGYLPWLLVAGAVTGTLTGVAAKSAARGITSYDTKKASRPASEPFVKEAPQADACKISISGEREDA